jgi:hypothetical protein
MGPISHFQHKMNIRASQDVEACAREIGLGNGRAGARAFGTAAGMAIALWVFYTVFGRALARYVRALRGRDPEDASFEL